MLVVAYFSQSTDCVLLRLVLCSFFFQHCLSLVCPDIAAPECIIPEFDYKLKWIISMLTPVIFMGLLLLIFLSIVFFKFIKKMCRCGGKSPKYCSHANKLVAVYIIVFYFIYY